MYNIRYIYIYIYIYIFVGIYYMYMYIQNYTIYDMPMSTRTISNVDMYADISACGKNVQEIELKLTNDLQEISNWCDENRMVVNVEKTKKNGNTSTKRTLT